MNHPGNAHYWWQTATVYQIYPRSFQDTTGNGVGDLQGIIDRMPYLSDTLGVDAIWISPFYPSPMADFGYDVSDYCDVDPLFGDLATFDRLLAAAHEANVRVLVDFVPSHSSDRHRWFIESRASRDNPKRDWYVWRDPKANGSPPNNWLSVFGGPAWTLDEATGQYYRHSFLKEQPDLDWRNPDVVAAMHDAMRFWLDRGVDGFRLDAVPMMMKDPAERDNPPNTVRNPSAHKDMGEYDSQLHLYDKEHEDLHEVFRGMRAVLDAYEPPRTSLGEIHVFDVAELATYYGDELDEVNIPANFNLLAAPWTAAGIRDIVDRLEAALPDGAWANYVLGNHDEQRLATRISKTAAWQGAVLLLTLRGSPTLYYGDEIGMPEATIPPDRRVDPWGIAEPQLSRDGCRTPMQWSAEPMAGFSAASDTWLPVSADYSSRNVKTCLQDDESLLNLYRRLLTLRKRHTALQWGNYTSLDVDTEQCFVFQRQDGQVVATVIINFAGEEIALDLPAIHGTIAVSTIREREGLEVQNHLVLRPFEALVIT